MGKRGPYQKWGKIPLNLRNLYIFMPQYVMFRPMLKMAERLIAPHLCPVCDAEVTDRGLCLDCWKDLKFIADQACYHCGTPFDIPMLTPLISPESRGGHGPRGAICGQCLMDPPDFDHAVSALVYADPARRMILALKHGDRQDIAPILARMMAPKTIPLMERADFILPLPLHRRRFLKRRFNQSAELTRHLIALQGLIPDQNGGNTMDTSILIRKKATAPQGRKSKAQRIAAMRGAFAVPQDQRARIKGKTILMIDDVLTTGASLSSAARCLKRAGAGHIAVSTVARVC